MLFLLLIIFVLVIILMSIDPIREFIIPTVVSQPLIYDLALQSRSDFINQYIGDFLPHTGYYFKLWMWSKSLF